MHQLVHRPECVGVNNDLLVGVVDRGADVAEKGEAFLGAEAGLVAVVGDRDAFHQLHGEVRAAGAGGPGVEHLGDVRVVHHRQCLALGLEAGEHLFGVHPGLDHPEGDHPRDRYALFGHPDGAETPFADLLAEFVGADDVSFLLGIGFLELLRAEGGAVGVAEERSGAFGIDQQALDFEVELGVVAAGLGEECAAFRGGQFTGLGEEVLGGSGHDRVTRVNRRKKRTGEIRFLPVAYNVMT